MEDQRSCCFHGDWLLSPCALEQSGKHGLVQESSPSGSNGNAVETQVGTRFAGAQHVMLGEGKAHWPAALLF